MSYAAADAATLTYASAYHMRRQLMLLPIIFRRLRCLPRFATLISTPFTLFCCMCVVPPDCFMFFICQPRHAARAFAPADAAAAMMLLLMPPRCLCRCRFHASVYAATCRDIDALPLTPDSG